MSILLGAIVIILFGLGSMSIPNKYMYLYGFIAGTVSQLVMNLAR